jgi:hypothetical protein
MNFYKQQKELDFIFQNFDEVLFVGGIEGETSCVYLL